MKRKTIFATLGALVVLVLAAVQYFGPLFGPLFFGKPVYLVEPGLKRTANMAYSLLDTRAYYSSGDVWQNARSDVQQRLAAVSDADALQKELNAAAKIAGGKHSFVVKQKTEAEQKAVYKKPVVRKDGDLLMLILPEFSAPSEEAQDYADTLAEALQEDTVRGVIVDLRGNGGGDMGPMVAGLAPLLPDGDLLYFVAADGNKTAVTLVDGAVSGGGTPLTVAAMAKRTNLPVAVLCDGKTASSAEATFIALMANTHMRSFGAPTAGYTSANMTFSLPYDLLLGMTIAVDEAKNGQRFEEVPISPDVLTDKPEEAAKAWLQNEMSA